MVMSSDQVRIGAVKEVTYGTTPDSPAFVQARLLSESLGLEANNILSQELSPERGVTDSIFAGAEASGSLEAYAVKNALFEDWWASILGNAWSTDTLTPGNTRDGWSIEKVFVEADGVTPFYHLYSGVTISAMTIAIAPNDAVGISYSLVGGKLATSGTRGPGTPTDGPVAPTVDLAPVMVAQDVTMTWGGALAGIQTHCQTAMELTIDSQNEGIQCIGTLGSADTILGKLQVTGSNGPLLLSDAVFTSWLAQSAFTLDFDLVDSLGNNYNFALPQCKVQNAQAVAESTGSNVTVPFEWAALLPSPAITIVRS